MNTTTPTPVNAAPMPMPGPVPQVVGLRYAPENGLPQVILKGSGPLASDLLKRCAQGHATPIVHSPSLLRALYRLPVDCHIGPELFGAVAAILAHVISVDATRANPPSKEPTPMADTDV